MAIDKILVILFSLMSTGFVYWFFLMKNSKDVVAAGKSINIIVDGGYQPETISIALGSTTTLTFLRRDPSSCLEEVVLPDFKIRKFLPLNKKVNISISPKKAGEYEIVCGMNMFHGKILVK
ncbi:MAG: cupredoxin domain-containing protein [Patescibacteria group bacterium]